jgi:membrane protease YdiL (CAAX protease family)
MQVAMLFIVITIDYFYNLNGYAIILYLLLILFIIRGYTPPRKIKISLGQLTNVLIFTILFLICIVSLNGLSSVFFSDKIVFTYSQKINDIPFLIKGLILFPVIEEFYFRGVLMNSLLRGPFRKFALIISTLIFTLAHIYTDTGLIYIFTQGVLFGLLFQMYNNVYISIASHLLLNFIILIIFPKIIIQLNNNDFIDTNVLLVFLFLAIITIIILLRNKFKI